MNDFNKLMRYASLKAQKAEIEKEMKEIENHFKATTGTKENPQCVGCFRVWITESETTSYNKAVVLAKCPEAIKHGKRVTLYIK